MDHSYNTRRIRLLLVVCLAVVVTACGPQNPDSTVEPAELEQEQERNADQQDANTDQTAESTDPSAGPSSDTAEGEEERTASERAARDAGSHMLVYYSMDG